MLTKLKAQAQTLKREAYALSIAARDERVPWYAKVFMGIVLAYAFSPIDLIPDIIPVLGYLDDLLIVPLGIALALKMTPAEVMAEARRQADEQMRQEKPVSLAGAVVVVVLWLIVLTAAWAVMRS